MYNIFQFTNTLDVNTIIHKEYYACNLCKPVHIGKLNKTKLVDFDRFQQSRNLVGCIVACSKEKSQ